jgi:hypothetical protein
MTHGDGKSDTAVVPRKLPNKAAEPAAGGQGEGGGRGKTLERNTLGLRAGSVPSALSGYDRLQGNKQLRFTTLLHHVYDVERLRQAYFALKREAAAGIDSETGQHYGER